MPAKASIWFVACGIFKDAIDILVTPIFTRVLTVEEYGLFNVYNSWYQILRVIFTLNLCSDVYTVGLAKYAENRRKYVSAVQGLLTVILLILAGVFFSMPYSIAAIMGVSAGLVYLMFFQITAYVPYNAWLQQNRFDYKYKLITGATIAYVTLQPLIGLTLIAIGVDGYSGGELRIVGAVAVQVVFGLAIYIYNFIKQPTFFDKNTWRFSAGMNLPLIPHFLAQVLLLQSARIIIDATIGKGATAVYSVANSAAFVIVAIVLNLNKAFLPWLYQKLNKRDTAGVSSYTTALFLISAASVLLIVLVAPEAMGLLAPPSYVEGVWIMPPLAFSVHLLFTYTQFSNIQLYYENRMRIVAPAICGTVVCVLLGMLLIPAFGFLAAGYTTLAGYFTIVMLHSFFLLKTCREEHLDVHSLFNVRLIVVITFALALLCGVITLLYGFMPLLRYGLCLVILIIAIMNRKRLVALFADFKTGKAKRAAEESAKEGGE